MTASMKLKTLILSILFTACGVFGGQGAGAPDKFTEALMYEGYAAGAFACAEGLEPVAAAIRWTHRAIESMESFHAGDRDRQERAREALQRMLGSLEGLHEWDRFISSELPKTERLLTGGHLSAAEKKLPSNAGPECDPRLSRILRLVAKLREEFQRLVREGDNLCPGSPSEARARYQAALRLDRDDPAVRSRVRNVCRPKDCGDYPCIFVPSH